MTDKYCIHCENYINHNFSGNVCKLYRQIDLVDGKHFYTISCRDARYNENKCGVEAKHFVWLGNEQ